MKTINNESDFKLLVGYSDGSPINEPFRFTFYTKVSRGTFIAEYNGSEYLNCYPDGDMVKIPFDKPMLGMGVLSAKIELFLSDADFTDGKYDYVSVEPTGIILDKGATEPYEDMEVLISKPNTRGLQMFLSKPFTEGGGGGGGGEIPNGSVTEYKLATGAVSTAKIKDGAVTMAKLSDEVKNKLNQGGGSGEKGEDGKSAYEIWLEQGNEGSEQDFLESLKGDKGDQGERGEQGIQGIQGEKGEKGDKMTYDDLSEEEKDDLASRVEVPAPEIPEELLSEIVFSEPTEEVVGDIEATLVTTAIRKTPQTLTEEEKGIARANIGAASAEDIATAISQSITNALNTEV